jgi:ADP-ribose pyrophosphatase YjhB (NUDIX family)
MTISHTQVSHPNQPPSLLSNDIPPTTYLSANPSLDHLVVSGIVIHAKSGRALLIQRASHDGFPLKWECPGGGVEPGIDATILDALSREVREETGLIVTRDQIVGEADMIEFLGHDGTKWRKITFLVVIGGGDELPKVEVNPEEHQDAVWATEEEVLAGQCAGRT